MRRATALLCLGVLLGLPLAVAQTPELEVKLRLAVRKLEQGDALGAFLDLERLLSEDDRYWKAYYERGRAQAVMGDDLGARTSFRRAAALDPGNPELHFLMATISLQLADFETAWSHVVAAIQGGYDRGLADRLMKGLRAHSSEPPGLRERLVAPRVVVSTVIGKGDGELQKRLDALAFELRSGLLGAPRIALVQDPAIARYALEVESLRGDVEPIVGAGFSVTLVDLGSLQQVYRGEIDGSGELESAETQLQVMDRIDEIEAWFAERKAELRR